MKSKNSVIIYEGPSRIDGKPIVAVATGFQTKSANTKTGAMIQLYILNKDIAPLDAIRCGKNESICGQCPMKKHMIDSTMTGPCYVNVGQGPTMIYKAYKKGRYSKLQDYNIFKDRFVRFGAYGEPTALPIEILENIAKVASGWTGYTHRWAYKNNQQYKKFCVASTDNIITFQKATKLGWQSFRHATSAQDKNPGETICLAESKGTQCEDCRLCNGRNKINIIITRHGPTAKHFKGD